MEVPIFVSELTKLRKSFLPRKNIDSTKNDMICLNSFSLMKNGFFVFNFIIQLNNGRFAYFLFLKVSINFLNNQIVTMFGKILNFTKIYESLKKAKIR